MWTSNEKAILTNSHNDSRLYVVLYIFWEEYGMKWDGPEKDMGYFPSSTFLDSWISLLQRIESARRLPWEFQGWGNQAVPGSG